jgi:hypothetical protein
MLVIAEMGFGGKACELPASAYWCTPAGSMALGVETGALGHASKFVNSERIRSYSMVCSYDVHCALKRAEYAGCVARCVCRLRASGPLLARSCETSMAD